MKIRTSATVEADVEVDVTLDEVLAELGQHGRFDRKAQGQIALPRFSDANCGSDRR